MRISLLLSFLLLVGCADAPETPATEADMTAEAEASVPDDLAALGSPAVESLLRNDLVHVHHVTLAPGDSIAPHRGGERVIYSLADYTIRFTTEGETEAHSFTEGDVHRHDAGVHAVATAGDAPAEYIVFERREGTMAAGDAPDPVDASAEGVTDEVILDDDFAEVHRVTLEPGAQLPPHQGFARAIYSLSGYTVEFTGPDGTREEQFEAGQAHYHEPGDHTVENAGDTVAEFLVVEFKR